MREKAGEPVFGTKIFCREVAEICLNCQRKRCENVDNGCPEFRRAMRKPRRKRKKE